MEGCTSMPLHIASLQSELFNAAQYDSISRSTAEIFGSMEFVMILLAGPVDRTPYKNPTSGIVKSDSGHELAMMVSSQSAL